MVTLGFIRRIISKLLPHKAALIVAALISIYILTVGTLSLLKHFSYQTYAFDLGIFDQVMWNTIHGRLFDCSIIGRNYLGDHFAPVLLLLTPFYALFPTPVTLLVLQTVFLALGAVPVYWLARDKLGGKAGVVFSAAYLLYSPLEAMNLFEFHLLPLATTPLLFAFYYMDKERYKPALVFLALALLCKEDISLVVFAFGIYISMVKRTRLLGAGIAFTGLLWFILTFFIIIPLIRGEPYGYLGRYAYLGDSIPEMLITAITHPNLVLSHVLIKEKFIYFCGLLGPLAFFSLFSPLTLLLGLLPFAVNVLSDYMYQYALTFQYNGAIIPFIFAAAIKGMYNLTQHGLSLRFFREGAGVTIFRQTPLLVLMLAASLISNIIFSPSPISLSFHSQKWDIGPITPYYRGSYVIDQHDHTLKKITSLIPPEASISAAPHLVPHLSHRKIIYAYTYASEQMDYVIIDIKDRTWIQFIDEYRSQTQRLLSNPNYVVVAANDGVILFKRVRKGE